jgi:hypothetical protein
MSPPDDPLLEPTPDLDALLRGLPPRALDARVEARVLRTARAAFVEQTRGAAPTWMQIVWERVVAPALVTGTVATYLAWAVQSAGSLYR